MKRFRIRKIRGLSFIIVLFCLLSQSVTAELDWVRITTEYTPPHIDGHKMVYNIQNQECISFGWYSRNEDVPMYSYDGCNWYQIQPSGDWPSPRSHFGMAYDSSRNVVVVFGGFQGSFDYLGDTWEWDGTQWEEKFPVDSPTDRTGISMTYSVSMERIILFGGYTESDEVTNELWIWDGFEWVDATPSSGPSPRSASRIACDSAREKLVLFGGTETGSSAKDDTWEWDGVQWLRVFPDTVPEGRYHHVLLFDSSRNVVLMFGGLCNISGVSRETWEYDGIDWTQIQPDHRPVARTSHAACYDSARNRVVMYGGYAGGGSLNDTWEYYDVPPTSTPTITPTPTATPTSTPSPTPTSTPPDGLHIELHFPDTTIKGGDSFYLDITIENVNPDNLRDIPLFCLLEVADTFWYYPGWTMDPDWEILSTISTGTSTISVIEEFSWPDNTGTGTARFWAALTDQSIIRILGNYDVKDFGWE
ncbi:hypothetical protein K8T06_12530 [bacterium]|nr:hypothetical protein [bacterium]